MHACMHASIATAAASPSFCISIHEFGSCEEFYPKSLMICSQTVKPMASMAYELSELPCPGCMQQPVDRIVKRYYVARERERERGWLSDWNCLSVYYVCMLAVWKQAGSYSSSWSTDWLATPTTPWSRELLLRLLLLSPSSLLPVLCSRLILFSFAKTTKMMNVSVRTRTCPRPYVRTKAPGPYQQERPE